MQLPEWIPVPSPRLLEDRQTWEVAAGVAAAAGFLGFTWVLTSLRAPNREKTILGLGTGSVTSDKLSKVVDGYDKSYGKSRSLAGLYADLSMIDATLTYRIKFPHETFLFIVSGHYNRIWDVRDQ
jgi:hypothetical protein